MSQWTRNLLRRFTPAVSSQPSRETSTGGRVAILIGLDFGTHSTKIVVRRRGERIGRLLSIDKPAKGYPAFATPSLVRVSEGQVWFGREALLGQNGDLHRFLKLRLIDTNPTPRSERKTTDILVSAYLGWVLGEAVDWVDKQYGLSNCTLFLNVAAPMDHFENEEIKGRYLDILTKAWEWIIGAQSHRVSQGINIQNLCQWYDDLNVAVPSSAERRYDVLPETIAPIVSLSQDPRMSAGMYLLIDTGAGTTEMSINHVSVHGGDQNVLCYFDRSIRLGAERFSHEDPRRLIADLLANVWQTWCRGYEKDAPNHAARQRWNSLRILLLGGGTCRNDVFEAIRDEDHAIYSRFPGEATCDVLRHGPSDLHFDGARLSTLDLSLASVANGLAFPRQQWPRFYEPANVGAVRPTGAHSEVDSWFLNR